MPKPHIYCDEHQRDGDGNWTAFNFVIHYGRTKARITLYPSENQSPQASFEETLRAEVRFLAAALADAGNEPSGLSLRPPRRT